MKETQEEKKRREHTEYIDRLLAKIEREWSIRIELANLAGFKASVKNPHALEDTEFDLPIRDLYLEIELRCPENVHQALNIIQSYYKGLK
jgi:hypothetical protein